MKLNVRNKKLSWWINQDTTEKLTQEGNNENCPKSDKACSSRPPLTTPAYWLFTPPFNSNRFAHGKQSSWTHVPVNQQSAIPLHLYFFSLFFLPSPPLLVSVPLSDPQRSRSGEEATKRSSPSASPPSTCPSHQLKISESEPLLGKAS